MPFTSPGAAAGDALTRVLLEAMAQRRQSMLDDLTRKKTEADIAGAESDRQLRLKAEERAASEAKIRDARLDRQEKVQNAGIVVENTPKGPVGPEVRQSLLDTPYASLLSQQQTLPSSTVPLAGGAQQSDAGGTPFDILNKTPAELQQGRLEAERAREYEQTNARLDEQGKREDETRRMLGEQANSTRLLAATMAGDRRNSMTAGQEFNALRRQFVTETTAARTTAQQYQLMQAAMEAAKRGDLAAGAQGVLVTFQKLLDPVSVVRESEYARSGSGQALISRIEGAMQRLAKGGAGVPIDELQKFVSLGEQFAKAQAKFAQQSKTEIDAFARKSGLDPAFITRDYSDDGDSGGSPKTPSATHRFNPATGKVEAIAP
jgi:hypothetical protein